MQSLSRRSLLAGTALLPIAGLAATALAQERRQGPSLDPPLVACLLIKGRTQITLCDFVLERTRSNAVARFAEAEIDEHVSLRRQLAELGYDYPRIRDTARDAVPSMDVTVGIGTILPGASQFLAIDQEIANQSVETTTSELDRLRGRAFDQRFLNQQLDAHYHLFDTMTVFRRHASRDLLEVLNRARPVVERHIGHCLDLIAQTDPNFEVRR